MWEPIWVSRFRYWLLTGESSRSCLHSSRTRRVGTLKVRWRNSIIWVMWLVTEVVRSPGWDQGHDDQSRNVREVKIDILEGYIRTSERFQVSRVFFGVPGSYGNSPGEVMCLIGPYGKRRSRPQGLLRPSPCWSELDKGLGGRNTPLSFSLFPSSFPSWWTPTRSRIPSRSPLLGAPPLGGRPPPLPPLYTEGGRPLRHTIDLIKAVCGAPLHRLEPPSYFRSATAKPCRNNFTVTVATPSCWRNSSTTSTTSWI